jgi:hypothetical protein
MSRILRTYTSPRTGPRHRRLLRAAVVVSVLACVAFEAPIARAQVPAQQPKNVEEGRVRFARGIELYKEGDFHAALAEFRAAFATAPSFRIHYNLGQTLYQLQDYAGAVRAFDQYLSEGGSKIEPDRRKDVEADLAKLRPRVARLTFVVNVPSAELVIDDQPSGQAQGRQHLVSEGRRRISVTASGYLTETRVLDLAGAQRVDLTFELKPIGGAALPAGDGGATRAEPQRTEKSRAPFYVGLVATGALGAATGVTAIIAASKHSSFEKALQSPNDPGAIADARSSTRSAALVADVLGLATVVSAGLTVVAFVLTSGKESSTTGQTASARAGTHVSAVVGPTSFGLTGTF